MTVSVLIVDDSGFFRRRLAEMINSSADLKVIGSACNGQEAIDQAIKLKPDVITMDYEMPLMDGITAVKEIMRRCPTPILMFSSLTYEGARITLDSLEAGAVDYLPKNFEQISKSSAELKQLLRERLITVAGAAKSYSLNQSIKPKQRLTDQPVATRSVAPDRSTISPKFASIRGAKKAYKLIAIGTSTGGPVALQEVLTQLPASFSVPLVLIQHMPATFTGAFAERLNSLCKITVAEAKDGDILKPGLALLAPGGQQMMVTKGGRIKILPGDERINYKPSVDVTFGSASNVYGSDVLAIILTGMGADGCEGAKLLKQKGASIWAQDQSTSVIYGMPMAVTKAEIVDEILPLPNVGRRLCEVV